MRRDRRVSMALVGFLVLSVFSLTTASGRRADEDTRGKPAEKVKVSLRRISSSETMDILQKFPEMVPSYLASRKDDRELLTSVFRFSEVTAAPLRRAFPAARFYEYQGFTSPPYPYLMAVAGDKRYMMPTEFNKLLLASGLKVTDENIIELAKAFVLLAVGSEPITNSTTGESDGLDSFPQFTFLEAKRTKELISGISYDAKLKVKIDDRVEEWYFDSYYDEFRVISRGDQKGLIKQYDLVFAEPRGQLDQRPKIDIDTLSPSNAYVEWQGATPHYYIIVKRNAGATGDSVRFILSDFPPNAPDVYVRVQDTIRNIVWLLDTVHIDGEGAGSYFWRPTAESTGICKVGAGFADDTNPGATYRDTTVRSELAPEKVLTGTFPSAASESLKVYFCDQFFRNHPDSEAHAPVFAQCAKDAMLESWQQQVNTWGLDTPPDADHKHQVFINDNQNWYHNVPGAWAGPGGNRQIGLRYNLWYLDGIDRAYSSESIRVKVAVAHEFYHGIQWGLDSAKWNVPEWRWFHEGQARFLPSAQYETEEFLDANHIFPDAANKYLTQHLNTSLRTLGNYPIMGYPYCLFWRFIYEHFGRDSGGIQLVRDCYAESVGTDNSISQGKAAIDSAIAEYWRNQVDTTTHSQRVCLSFNDFLQTLDEFAVSCYINDPSFAQWYDPNDVYAAPSLTKDTAFYLGPNAIDSIKVIDSIPHSYGIDLIQVALNGDVDSLRIKRTFTGTGTSMQTRLVKVYPGNSFVIDSTNKEAEPGDPGWIKYVFRTDSAERVCLAVTRHDALDNTSGSYDVTFSVRRAVAVSDSLPITDTVIAGTEFTPRADVANRGCMKEVFDATFEIEGTAYSSTVACTLDAGSSRVVEFAPWSTIAGTFPTRCYVYIASDTTRGDDTLHGSLAALSNMWQARTALQANVSQGGSLAAVGDTLIYALRGGGSKAFYRYDKRSNAWTAMESLTYAVSHGASLTWDHGAYLYALRGTSPGNTHGELLRYDIAQDAWSEMPATGRPGFFGTASALAWGGSGQLYAIQGLLPFNTQGFFQYDTVALQWSLKQIVPKPCSSGASLCWDQGSYIYALCANKSRAFCRYVTSGSWSVRESTPSLVVHGAALTYNSLDDGIYAWSGATNPMYTNFWRYDGDVWSVRTSPPTDVGYGGALTGCDGYVYAQRGNGNTDFWRYFPTLQLGKSLREGVVAEQGTSIETNSFAVTPSPARGPVRLQWQVKQPGVVAVRVFDNTGRIVRTIQNGHQSAGGYSARWDGVCGNGRRTASGVFFYRMDAPGFSKIVKVVMAGK